MNPETAFTVVAHTVLSATTGDTRLAMMDALVVVATSANLPTVAGQIAAVAESARHAEALQMTFMEQLSQKIAQ